MVFGPGIGLFSLAEGFFDVGELVQEYGPGALLDFGALLEKGLLQSLDGLLRLVGLFFRLAAETVQAFLEVVEPVRGGSPDTGAGLPALVGCIQHTDGGAGREARQEREE